MSLALAWTITAAIAAPPAGANAVTPSAVVARIQAFGRRTPRFSVDVRAEIAGAPAGVGRIIVHLPDRQRFSMRFGPSDYHFVQRDGRAIEWEANQRMYFEFAVSKALVPPFARIDATPTYGYPGVAIPGSPSQRGMVNAASKVLGTGTLQGVQVDHVRTQERGPLGLATLDFWVDRDGRLRQYRVRLEGDEGTSDTTFRLTKWSTQPPQSPDPFSLMPPVNFSPSELPFLLPPVEIGQRVAWKGQVVTPQNGRAVPATQVLAQGRRTLLILTAPECAVSSRATALFTQLADMARKAGAASVRVSLGPTNPGSGTVDFWDRSGALEVAIGVVGTPMVLLFEADGRLIQAWVGDPPGSRDRVLHEVAERLSPPR